MPVAVPLIAGAAAVGGAAIASSGAKKQATAAQNVADQNNVLQQGIFDQQRADLAPWRTSGGLALAEINKRLGLTNSSATVPASQLNQPGGAAAPTVGGGVPAGNGGGFGNGYRGYGDGYVDPTEVQMSTQGANPNVLSSNDPATPQSVLEQPAQPAVTTPAQNGTTPTGDGRYSGFYASPGYQFRLDEGNRNITGSRAAGGMLQSGDTLRALNAYGQDYASNEYNTQLGQLFQVAGLGQSATNSGNVLASNYGAQVGQNNQNASNALQSSYATNSQAFGNALNTAGAGFANYYRQPAGFGGGQNPPSDLYGLY